MNASRNRARQERSRRLGERLRENLKRRKQQARKRAAMTDKADAGRRSPAPRD